MFQSTITPAAGKRLIARATAGHPAVRAALETGTVVIVAGTTNGYVAEEVLAALGQVEGFRRDAFMRGAVLPPRPADAVSTRPADAAGFPGDVVIRRGQWLKGKTIFDVLDELKEGDIILKGANAVDPARRQAAVLVAHPEGGTIIAALRAVAGRRVRLIIPVGLEKRVCVNLDELAARVNAPGASGPRLLPFSGEIITEIEALAALSGARAELAAAGGVGGAEGALWLVVDGMPEQERAARELLASLAGEPRFET